MNDDSNKAETTKERKVLKPKTTDENSIQDNEESEEIPRPNFLNIAVMSELSTKLERSSSFKTPTSPPSESKPISGDEDEAEVDAVHPRMVSTPKTPTNTPSFDGIKRISQ